MFFANKIVWWFVAHIVINTLIKHCSRNACVKTLDLFIYYAVKPKYNMQ